MKKWRWVPSLGIAVLFCFFRATAQSPVSIADEVKKHWILRLSAASSRNVFCSFVLA